MTDKGSAELSIQCILFISHTLLPNFDVPNKHGQTLEFYTAWKGHDHPLHTDWLLAHEAAGYARVAILFPSKEDKLI